MNEEARADDFGRGYAVGRSEEIERRLGRALGMVRVLPWIALGFAGLALVVGFAFGWNGGQWAFTEDLNRSTAERIFDAMLWAANASGTWVLAAIVGFGARYVVERDLAERA